jgi:hypothetical protein
MGRPEPISQLPTALPSAVPSPGVLSNAPPPAPPAAITAPPAPPGNAIIFERDGKKESSEAHDKHEGHEKHEAHEAHEDHASHEKHEEHEEEEHSAILFTGDVLLLRPVRRGQDYAVVGTNPNFGPLGIVRSVEGGYDSGFRVGAGYRCDCGWETVVSYTYFDTNDRDNATAPAGSFVFPSTTFPGVVTRAVSASANNSVILNLVDLEIAHHWKGSEHLDWRFSIGPRLAFIDQRFNALYTGGDVASDAVRRRSSMEAIGLRVGGEATYKVLEHLGAYARAYFSMMSGQFNSDLSENANGQPIVGVSEKFHKIIPVAEMGIGLSYQTGCWRFTAGYEVMNWFGMVEGIDFADDVTPGKYNRRTGDLGFEGFVFRAEVAF